MLAFQIVTGLISASLIAYGIHGVIGAYRFHMKWKLEFAEKEKTFHFWKNQCEQAIKDGNIKAAQLNVRRYEQEVLGWKKGIK